MGANIPIVFGMQVEGDSEVKARFESAGATLAELGKATSHSSAETVRLGAAFNEAALGVNGAIESAVSLYSSYGDLEKMELRIMQAEKGVDTARAGLLKSQAALQKLVEAGTASGAQYEAAQLRVEAAEKQLQIAQEKVSLSQGDLSDRQLEFALSVVPKVSETVTGLAGSLGGVRQAMAAASAASTMQKAVNLGSIGSFAALTGATTAQTLATRAATLATKLLQLATGPLGLVVLGVSTFMALFSSNAWGIRDSINAAGKAIGDAIPILRPLLDMLGGIANAIFPQAAEEASNFSTDTAASFQHAAAEAGSMQAATSASFSSMSVDVGTGVTAQSQALTNLNVVTQSTATGMSSAFAGMGSDAERAADRIARAARKAASALKSLGLAKGASSRDVAFKKASTGFAGVVTQPTIFLAGEAGPETVNIAPIRLGASGVSRPIVITVVTQLDGREVARTVSKHQAQEM